MNQSCQENGFVLHERLFNGNKKSLTWLGASINNFGKDQYQLSLLELYEGHGDRFSAFQCIKG
jgi:hypothetical protein